MCIYIEYPTCFNCYPFDLDPEFLTKTVLFPPERRQRPRAFGLAGHMKNHKRRVKMVPMIIICK